MRHPCVRLLLSGAVLAACGGQDENRRPASIVVVSGDGQTAEVGQTLPQPVVVEVRDASNDPLKNQTVSWLVLLGNGAVPVPNTVTDAQGRASTMWTLGYTFGAGHTLRIQAGAVQTAVTASATLGAGSTLTPVAGLNQTGAVNVELGTRLGVRVRTVGGQDIASVPIDWTVAGGGGTLSSASTTTAANGVATVAWTLGPGAGTQDVTAAHGALTPATVTFSATAIVPAPSQITGTITLSDSLVTDYRAAIRATRGRASTVDGAAIPARQPPPTVGRVDPFGNELLVRFKAGAVGAPSALRARADLATSADVSLAIRALLAAHTAPGRVTVTGVSPVILTARIRVTDTDKVDSVAKALAGNPAVALVGRNGRLRATGGPVRPGTIPTDPFYPAQSWHYSMIDLPRAWSRITGSPNVVVAVLDNGAVFHHPSVGDPAGTYQTGGGNYTNDGYDFVHSSIASLCAALGGGSVDNAGDGDGYDPDPSTPDDRDLSDPPEELPCQRSTLGSHGTQVAGILGAKQDNASIVGVSWQVSLRPVRVLGIDGGDYYDIAQGVLYAGGLPADDGAGGVLTPPLPARVINMSLGGACLLGPDPLLDAVRAVTDPGRPFGGTLVVVSSGNTGSSDPLCPAVYDEVLAVGAVGPGGGQASYSSYGGHVDLAAPGGEFPVGDLGVVSIACDFSGYPSPCTPNHVITVGTSLAAPHVAGVAALLAADNPSLSQADLRGRLTGFGTPLPVGNEIGSLVNARNALTQSTSPARQLFVRSVDAGSGAAVTTMAAVAGAPYTIPAADGTYFVVAGEDEEGDGEIGLPGRRFAAFGGASSPVAVPVTSTVGGHADFRTGYPVEEESNDLPGSANRLIMPGAVQGFMGASDGADFFVVQIPAAGTYSFETTGVAGAFCGFALDLDTVLELRNSSQAQLAASVDVDPGNLNYCSRISLALAAGTYYVRVTRDLINGAPHTGRYLLQARAGP